MLHCVSFYRTHLTSHSFLSPSTSITRRRGTEECRRPYKPSHRSRLSVMSRGDVEQPTHHQLRASPEDSRGPLLNSPLLSSRSGHGHLMVDIAEHPPRHCSTLKTTTTTRRSTRRSRPKATTHTYLPSQAAAPIVVQDTVTHRITAGGKKRAVSDHQPDRSIHWPRVPEKTPVVNLEIYPTAAVRDRRHSHHQSRRLHRRAANLHARWAFMAILFAESSCLCFFLSVWGRDAGEEEGLGPTGLMKFKLKEMGFEYDCWALFDFFRLFTEIPGSA